MNGLPAPNEAEIRSAIRSRASDDDAGAVVLDELGICRGQVRVDVAVVNGIIHGYEIKSDRDNLRRLNGQIDLYGRVLDRATLVVGSRHLAGALDLLPTWWAVLRVDATRQGARLRAIRKGRKNPGRDPRALVELLWLDDALELLESRGADRGIRGKPRRVVWDRVCEHFSVEEIAAAVRKKLKARAEPLAHP